MSNPCELRPCALHVLVPSGEVVRPDPSGLLGALGHHTGELIVRTVPDADGAVPLATVVLAAAVIDDLADRPGLTVRYEEHAGDLVDALRRDAERGVRPVVVLSAACSPRTVRRVRRAVVGADAHVAVVPSSTPEPHACEGRR